MELLSSYKRLKPHLLMILAQMGYTFLYFITEASFSRGMNVHVYITYRHIVGGFFMLPFAYFLERDLRPKLTWKLFFEIFVLSLLGVSLTLNMYFASLKFTSPAFVSSMVNTIASMTFVIAILLRYEKLDVRKARGKAKVIGTVVSLVGVTIMTFYKGPAIENLWGALAHIQGSVVHESWVKGSILTVASCVAWSFFYIMQASTLTRYPAQISLTTWMNFVGAAQSAVFTVCVAHKKAEWQLGLDVNLCSILYGGIIVSGVMMFMQFWCIEEKGPVFVTMFNPLCTILVAVLAYFVFGEKLYSGSIIGGVTVIVGLYLVLWGKEKDQELDAESRKPEYSDHTFQEDTIDDSFGNSRSQKRSTKISEV